MPSAATIAARRGEFTPPERPNPKGAAGTRVKLVKANSSVPEYNFHSFIEPKGRIGMEKSYVIVLRLREVM
jgi:hypothetical protein